MRNSQLQATPYSGKALIIGALGAVTGNFRSVSALTRSGYTTSPVIRQSRSISPVNARRLWRIWRLCLTPTSKPRVSPSIHSHSKDLSRWTRPWRKNWNPARTSSIGPTSPGHRCLSGACSLNESALPWPDALKAPDPDAAGARHESLSAIPARQAESHLQRRSLAGSP